MCAIRQYIYVIKTNQWCRTHCIDWDKMNKNKIEDGRFAKAGLTPIYYKCIASHGSNVLLLRKRLL